MTPEEFERLKAKEREHLEKMRELKQAVRKLEQQRSVANALSRLESSAREMIDRNAEIVDTIARETAMLEARTDMALEASDEAPPDPGLEEEELRKLRAQKLIEEIKQETAAKPAERNPAAGRTSVPPEKEDPAPAPEKTIGRMR